MQRECAAHVRWSERKCLGRCTRDMLTCFWNRAWIACLASLDSAALHGETPIRRRPANSVFSWLNVPVTYADFVGSTPPLAVQSSVRRHSVGPVAPLGHCDMPQRRWHGAGARFLWGYNSAVGGSKYFRKSGYNYATTGCSVKPCWASQCLISNPAWLRIITINYQLINDNYWLITIT